MADSIMRYSTRDMVAFVGELNRRIASVTQSHSKRGRPLVIGSVTFAEMKTARRLFYRFLKGDWRHTDTELAQCKSLADWLVAKHAELNGVDARPWVFDAAALASKHPVKVNWVKHG